MAFTQLNPPIPLDVLDHGKGHAIGMIDYGPDHGLIWVTAIDDTGEIVCAPNDTVRMESGWVAARPRAHPPGPVFKAVDPIHRAIQSN